MISTEQYTRICPICGKKIIYTVKTEDGYDWEGHQRGQYSSTTENYDCDCEKSLITRFKRMCINCRFYNSTLNTCEQSNMEKDIKNKIQNEILPMVVENISMKLHKDLITCACRYWKFNPNIIEQYSKKEE